MNAASGPEIILIVGARPNFMKAAPVLAALRAGGGCRATLVHTGQHYQHNMSGAILEDLGLPEPDVCLHVGSGSHAEVTGRVMIETEKLFAARAPSMVLVFGDVNSTLAAALAAAKLHIPVGHVEAGLRSGDRGMPEELNRICTDHLSAVLFVSERSGLENLRREGIPAERVHFVGNCMIDTLLAHRERARACRAAEKLGLAPRGFAAVTLHRPSNVDHPEVLAGLIEALGGISRRLPVIWPIHPRSRQRLEDFGLRPLLESHPGIRLAEPLGYLEFLNLLDNARLVLTDSGGIQEETTILGVPCLTLRANTERPVTITEGANRLVGSDPAAIAEAAREALDAPMPGGRRPELWDGHAGERVAEICRQILSTSV